MVRTEYDGNLCGEHESVQAAVADLRDWWNEDPEEPVTFLVRQEGPEGREQWGAVLAVLMRDNSDPEVCHTLYADGRCESHRCRYVLNAEGKYDHTEVTEIARIAARGHSHA